MLIFKSSKRLSQNYSFDNFMTAIPSWLTFIELWNRCFTDDDGYVQIVVTTIASIPFSECDLPNYTYHRDCTRMRNTTSTKCGTGSAFSFGATYNTAVFCWSLFLVFYVAFSVHLFVFWHFL